MVVVHSGYGEKAKAGGFQVKKIQNKPIEPPTATVTPKRGGLLLLFELLEGGKGCDGLVKEKKVPSL